MILKEEYARISDKPDVQEGKQVISDDAFAICDFIERLINKVEHARLCINK